MTPTKKLLKNLQSTLERLENDKAYKPVLFIDESKNTIRIFRMRKDAAELNVLGLVPADCRFANVVLDGAGDQLVAFANMEEGIDNIEVAPYLSYTERGFVLACHHINLYLEHNLTVDQMH